MIPNDLMPIMTALREGRTDDAERLCRTALAARPDQLALLQLSAHIALAADRVEDAFRQAAAALARAPDHGPTLMVVGRAARARGDKAGAIAGFRRAAVLAPGRAEPAFLLCAALLDAGDPEALAVLDRVSAEFPDDAAGWDEIGRTLARAGKTEAALAAFSRAYDAAPSVALGLRRAAALKDLRRLDETRDALDAAARLGPLPAPAWFMLGLVQQDLSNLPASAQAYRAALDCDPTLAEAAVNLGIVLQEMGDLDAAKVAYGQAIRVRPDTFGRVAQAMTSPRQGELWLDLAALRIALAG